MSVPALRFLRLTEPAEGVAVVTFARPQRHNAVHDEMRDEILAVVDALAQGYPQRYRCAVLRGEGAAFCAGGDLEAFRAMLGQPRHVIQAYIASFHQHGLGWYELPMPTVAALHGTSVGGGAAMAMHCDFRYAAADTVLRFSFAQIGLVPDMGSHYVLSTIVGPARALELLLSGDAVAADEALRLGLVSQVLPSRETADAAAVGRATSIALAPPEVMRDIKASVRQAWHSSMAETMAREVALQTDRFMDPLFARRIEQFLDKKTRTSAEDGEGR